MGSADRMRADLTAVLEGGARGLSAADRLCVACVDLLEVDGAAVSLVLDGTSRGTFGSSGELSRRLDEFQFTFGEGPCHDAVSKRRPVLVDDLDQAREQRWPAFARAMLGEGMRAVFSLPVAFARRPVGALDLFRHEPGPLSPDELDGGLVAADLASLPLLDLMNNGADWASVADGGAGVDELASLERVEVYQAAGMVMVQLDVGPAEAVARLRAYAFAQDMTTSEVAWDIVERRLRLEMDDFGPGPKVAL